MSEINEKDLMITRMSLLIGTIIGQTSELLNNINRCSLDRGAIYKGLFDIHQSAGLQAHEIFYKCNIKHEDI